MIPTKIYTVTLAALGSFRLQVAGRFFKILTASGSVTLVSDFGTLTPLTAGNGLQKTPFNYLYFTDLSGGANTLTVVVGDENFLDNSLGSVAVTSQAPVTSSAFTQVAANVTNVSAVLLAANIARKYYLIQNNDVSGIVYVNLTGAAATAANGLRIPPGGGSLEVGPCVPLTAISAIGSIAANANVIVVEG